MDWYANAADPKCGHIDMPGRVLDTSTIGDRLYVLCYDPPKWWQFWRPPHEKRLYSFKLSGSQ